jgi:hypothetical protein
MVQLERLGGKGLAGTDAVDAPADLVTVYCNLVTMCFVLLSLWLVIIFGSYCSLFFKKARL